MLLFAASIVSPAPAQGFDARGPQAPPDGPDPADAPWVVGPTAGAGSVVLGMGWLEQPLVRVFPDGQLQPVLDDVLSTRLEALSPALGPVQLGASLPLILSAGGEAGGAGLADLRLSAPVSLLRGGALRLGPLLRLPTGAPERYLGDRGLGVGARLSGHQRVGPVALAADAGLLHDPPTDQPDWPGGLLGLGALSVGVLPTDAVGLHLGWRSRAPPAAPEHPSELGLSAKIRAPSGAFASLSGARALTRGIGAPPLRLQLSLGLSSPDPEPEPVLLPRVEVIEVHDPQHRPVRGAQVRLEDGRQLQTDALGRVQLPTDALGIVSLQREGFVSSTLELPEPAVGLDPLLQVTLVHPLVPIQLRVVDPEGQPLSTPPILEPTPPEPLRLDEVGTWHGLLPVGDWILITDNPGMGRQRRTVTIEPGATRVEIDAIVQPILGDRSLELKILDPQGDPVDQARLALGDQLLGSTSTGGDLTIEGLPEEVEDLVVASDVWDDPRPVPVELDASHLRVITRWPEGSVWIEALDPAGQPADAVVAFRGPAPLPPAPLGADGRRLFQLRPGLWTLAVSSPTLGIQERSLEVLPGSEPARLTVILQPAEAGDADLTVSVLGPEGPVAGATVLLDGAPLGRTGPGGALAALGLRRGSRTLQIEAPLLQAEASDVDLFQGGQALEVPASWAPGALELVVTDPDGLPIDAQVALDGPEPQPSLALGPDGTHRLALPPGRWTLAFSAPGWGPQARALHVPDAPDGLRRLRVRLLPPGGDGALSLSVHDPDGQPIRSARITLGGERLGTLTDGALQIGALPRGAGSLQIEAEAMQPVTQRIRITRDTALDVALGWAPGALRVEVSGPEGPADALLALSGLRTVPPRRTGPGGQALLGLEPGAWRLFASSADLGATELDLSLPEAPQLTRQHVQLGATPPAADIAVLLLRVRDPDGAPIAGAVVHTADRSLQTSAGGSALLTDLAPGAQLVRVDGLAGFVPRELRLELEPGSHERIVLLEPVRQRVGVQVRDTDNQLVSAIVVAEGRETITEQVPQGAEAVLWLTPGPWRLTARAEAGLGTLDVEVIAGEDAPGLQLGIAPTTSRLADGQIVLGQPVPFDLDQHDLRPDASPILDDVARLLRAQPHVRTVEVQGHTDDRGGVAYNQDLSERRAAAVVAALVARGVDPERLVARGYGLMRPVRAGRDDETRALNRRVELVVREQ